MNAGNVMSSIRIANHYDVGLHWIVWQKNYHKRGSQERITMGLYDYVSMYLHCPFCGRSRTFDGQTKDLQCFMREYKPLTRVE